MKKELNPAVAGVIVVILVVVALYFGMKKIQGPSGDPIDKPIDMSKMGGAAAPPPSVQGGNRR